MITANEFRLGNKVITYDENWQEMDATITLACQTHYCVKEHNSAMLWEHLKPIPLTEEWLVEFGFSEMYATKNEHHPFFKRSGFGKEIELYPPKEKSKHPNAFRFVVGGVRVQSFHIDVQYVHQLQNLYFALTGEELNLVNP